MSCRSGTDMRILAAAIAASALLSGCSDIYFDRRETIAPHAGDAMASNRVTHMVDPWSPASANRNIAVNGEVMQHAVERYRQGRVIPPVNATTSSAAYARAQATAAGAAQSARSSTSTSGGGAPSAWAAKQQPSQPPSQTPATFDSQPADYRQSEALQPGETR